MRWLVAVLVLLVVAPSAQAEPFDIAAGDEIEAVAGGDNRVYAVTRGPDGGLSACVLPSGVSRCLSSTALPVPPEGAQAGFDLVRRRTDRALFVLDARDTGTVWITRSPDSGLTWTTPVLVATGFDGLGDAALTALGDGIDIVSERTGQFARVGLDGPPETPFLSLSADRRNGSANAPSLANMRNGTTLLAFGEDAPPGPGRSGLQYGFRRHAAGGDLRAEGAWSAWAADFGGGGFQLFSGPTQTWGVQTTSFFSQGAGNAPAATVAQFRAGGKVAPERVVRRELRGFAVGAVGLQAATLHVATADDGRVMYTRTRPGCWFGKPAEVAASGPSSIVVASARSARGFVGWVEGQTTVRANWFSGGAPNKRRC